MKLTFTKILLIILLAELIFSCSAEKKVGASQKLLKNNIVLVNSKNEKNEVITNQLIQKPNANILGFPLRLHLYNLANENSDSLFKSKFIQNPKKYKNLFKILSKKQVDRLGNSFWYSGWHNFLKKTGEKPVIVDEKKAEKSAFRLKAFYFNDGYFRTKTSYKIDSLKNKKAKITYSVETGKPTFLDTISAEIQSPSLKNLYQIALPKTVLKVGQQYKTLNLEAESARLTSYFKNKGVYFFQQQSISYVIDTLNLNYKAPLKIKIANQTVKKGDTLTTKPYDIYTIGDVNVFITDSDTRNVKTNADSVFYNNYNLYSTQKLRYRPKAITNSIFIYKDSLYSDKNHELTLKSISSLRNFKFPKINYIQDTLNKKLKTNVFLVSVEKYKFNANIDATHSNIQDFGIIGSTSVSIRNIFRGAEILEIGLRGNLGSSRDAANPKNVFFNVFEIGADIRLSFPRLFLPFKTDKIIPKRMFPTTIISGGFAKQQNIGLDKENVTGILSYSWKATKNSNSKLDLINFQYVKNVNIKNYFNVYQSSYNRLNDIALKYTLPSSLLNEEGNLSIENRGTDAFIKQALSNTFAGLNNTNPDYNIIKSINERKNRLTENNLIFSSNFTYSITTKRDLFDKEFFSLKAKGELAGNMFNLIANLSKQPKNSDGTKRLFELEYSQYAKTEIEYTKHWDLQRSKVFAFRSFVGLAIPYGNSTSIPFPRSYFAGGSNDNRAWQSYSLGPGSSGGTNDFNEANLKIALNAEFRFKYTGNLYGALFADCGNIWNVLDSETDKSKIFSGLTSLKSIALGTGTGFRYDFRFFILRLDLGFKTYNPANLENKRWLSEYNFKKSVVNIGINYPF